MHQLPFAGRAAWSIRGALVKKRGNGESPSWLVLVAVAGLQAVPSIGGVIATFIDEYVPRQMRRRLVSFVRDHSARLPAEVDRVERESVRTEDLTVSTALNLGRGD